MSAWRIRREIRRREGLLIYIEDLASAMHSCFSIEAREKMGPMRIRKKRKPAKKTEAGASVHQKLIAQPEAVS